MSIILNVKILQSKAYIVKKIQKVFLTTAIPPAIGLRARFIQSDEIA